MQYDALAISSVALYYEWYRHSLGVAPELNERINRMPRFGVRMYTSIHANILHGLIILYY